MGIIKRPGNEYDFKENLLYPIKELYLTTDKGEKEIYRLVVNGSLFYAKCKINFKWNRPRLGDNKIHWADLQTLKLSDGVWHNSWTRDARDIKDFCIYGFYGDGFYLRNHNKYIKYEEEELSNILYGEAQWGDFEGWYTKKEGGEKIEKIRDIKSKTTLFDYKNKNTIPEITLYGHWKVHSFTIKVNIPEFYCKEKPSLKSKPTWQPSIKQMKKKFVFTVEENSRKEKFLVFHEVPVYTDIISFIEKRINRKSIKYVTWAKNILGNNAKLKQGPQKFLGWQVYDNDSSGFERSLWWNNDSDGDWTKPALKSYIVSAGNLGSGINTFYVYPCFQVLVIVLPAKTSSGKTIKGSGKFYTFTLPTANIWDEDTVVAVWKESITTYGGFIEKYLGFPHGYPDGYPKYHWKVTKREGIYSSYYNNDYYGYPYSSTIVIELKKDS